MQRVISRLIERSIALKRIAPGLLLESLDLVLNSPSVDPPEKLIKEIREGRHVFPRNTVFTLMSNITRLGVAYPLFFQTLCYNAASLWNADIENRKELSCPAERQGGSQGRKELPTSTRSKHGERPTLSLSTQEIHVILSFFALHNNVHLPLLRRLLVVNPYLLKDTSDGIFLELFLVLQQKHPEEVSEVWKARAEKMVTNRSLPVRCLVRIATCQNAGLGGLRRLWKKLANRHLPPQDASDFIIHGLSILPEKMESTDVPMFNALCDRICQRNRTLLLCTPYILEICARNKKLWGSLLREGSNHSALPRNRKCIESSFLSNIVNGTIKVDVDELGISLLTWLYCYLLNHACMTPVLANQFWKRLEKISRGPTGGTEQVPGNKTFDNKVLTRYIYTMLHHTVLRYQKNEGAVLHILSHLIHLWCLSVRTDLADYETSIRNGVVAYVGGGKMTKPVLLGKSRGETIRYSTLLSGNPQQNEELAVSLLRSENNDVTLDTRFHYFHALSILSRNIAKQSLYFHANKRIEEALTRVALLLLPRDDSDLTIFYDFIRYLATIGTYSTLTRLLNEVGCLSWKTVWKQTANNYSLDAVTCKHINEIRFVSSCLLGLIELSEKNMYCMELPAGKTSTPSPLRAEFCLFLHEILCRMQKLLEKVDADSPSELEYSVPLYLCKMLSLYTTLIRVLFTRNSTLRELAFREALLSGGHDMREVEETACDSMRSVDGVGDIEEDNSTGDWEERSHVNRGAAHRGGIARMRHTDDVQTLVQFCIRKHSTDMSVDGLAEMGTRKGMGLFYPEKALRNYT